MPFLIPVLLLGGGFTLGWSFADSDIMKLLKWAIILFILYKLNQKFKVV